MLPESRVHYLEEQERYSSEVRGIGPCGGFSTQYACMCDYHALPYREEVAWVSFTKYFVILAKMSHEKFCSALVGVSLLKVKK